MIGDIIFLFVTYGLFLFVSHNFSRFMAGYAIGGWIQVFYRRVHGIEPSVCSKFMMCFVALCYLFLFFIPLTYYFLKKNRN